MPDEKVQDNETESEDSFPRVTLSGVENYFFSFLSLSCVTLQLSINQKHLHRSHKTPGMLKLR